ncbi:DUF7511 domain-containing protein [Natronobacterium texcoconense]|uniref:DUF7511 domain-containing protein n=1 Tax=Natronobacterium texcoconense TaxID=1095778 RepID=UPI001FCDDE06|nr:hypothetical protein [Natronobacterium texcoconense]
MTDDVTDHDTDGESDPGTRPAASEPDVDGPDEPDVSPCYQAYLERHDDRPDSCTIYSAVTAETPEKQWIRAWGDAFVSREDTR